MIQKKEDELLDSNYDGIQEYDNDLPRWWLYLFYITIAFASLYSAYVHFNIGERADARLVRNLKEIEALRQTAMTKQTAGVPEVGRVRLLTVTKDSQAVAKGQAVYAQNCSPCHGQKGEGIIGPNLTDKYWIHGGKIDNLYKTVQEGVLDKGMVPWKGVLPEEQIQGAVAYVWTLYGTNPPNAKEPQGNLEEREE